MSTIADRLTRVQWATILGDLDAPAFGEVVAAVNDANMIDGDPEATVQAAIDEGPLVEDTDAGMFGTIELAELTNQQSDDKTGGVLVSDDEGENPETAAESKAEEPSFTDANPRKRRTNRPTTPGIAPSKRSPRRSSFSIPRPTPISRLSTLSSTTRHARPTARGAGGPMTRSTRSSSGGLPPAKPRCSTI